MRQIRSGGGVGQFPGDYAFVIDAIMPEERPTYTGFDLILTLDANVSHLEVLLNCYH